MSGLTPFNPVTGEDLYTAPDTGLVGQLYAL